jgi:prephenate dehydrogenase
MTTQLPIIQPGRPGPASGAPPVFDKIGIVGLGLIGGSIALAARQLWPKALVIGVDHKDVLETAMRLHAIDVAADDLIVLAEADVVILAAPVKTNIALLAELDENIRQPAVVTDTGSTKRDIMVAASSLPARLTFIGGHPLAGAARGGLEYARADLFSGRPWLLTEPVSGRRHAEGAPAGGGPTDAAGAALAKLTAFVQALGAVPRMMGAQPHDRLLAFLSHLPQLTASALMQVIGESVGYDGLGLAGRGLADTTRLASSPPDIWRDIAASNADEIGPALDVLIERLQDLRRDLPDGDTLADVFVDAARWRGTLKR